MASITRQKNGRRTIQFVAGDGRRRSVRLGKLSQRMAESVKLRIELLLAAKISSQPLDTETALWLAAVDDSMADRLARVGLISPRERATATLENFLRDYVARRIDVEPATREVWKTNIRSLLTHFCENRDLRSIGVGDAEDFKLFLIGEGLAPTTVHKRLQFARQFFRDALRRKLLEENPFADVSTNAVTNTDRQYFVPRDDISRLLEVCNPIWQLIVNLSRYGGLRCPSEVLSLRWEDINWEANRIVVQSPKTKRHGKASRTIPMFPELVTVVSEAFDQAEEGTEHVVGGNYRQAALTVKGWRNCNLRTQRERLLKRAGLQPWPRLFQNLRASRETELAGEFPIHVVTAWMGNTHRIALKHYLQVTDTDFERATQGAAESGAVFARAMQNPVQHMHAEDCTNSQVTIKAPAKTGVLASSCKVMQELAKSKNGEDRIVSYPDRLQTRPTCFVSARSRSERPRSRVDRACMLKWVRRPNGQRLRVRNTRATRFDCICQPCLCCDLRRVAKTRAGRNLETELRPSGSRA